MLHTLIVHNLPGSIASERVHQCFVQYGFCRVELKK